MSLQKDPYSDYWISKRSRQYVTSKAIMKEKTGLLETNLLSAMTELRALEEFVNIVPMLTERKLNDNR